MVAIAAGPGAPSMLCAREPSDGSIEAWVVELDAEGAPRASSSPRVTLVLPEDAVPSRFWETLRLASGSPPFLLYQVWGEDQPVDELVGWNAQALAPDARPFEVAATEERLAATFVREGTVFVVVGIEGHFPEEGPDHYEVRALSPEGPRASQALDLMASAPRSCEGPLTTRVRAPGSLSLVLPLSFEFGEETSFDDRRVDLAGAFAVPGAQVWDAVDVCVGDREGPGPDGSPPLRDIPDALFVAESSDDHGPVLDDHVYRDRVAVAHDDGGFVAVYVRGSDGIFGRAAGRSLFARPVRPWRSVHRVLLAPDDARRGSADSDVHRGDARTGIDRLTNPPERFTDAADRLEEPLVSRALIAS